ncbi:filamentous hemagglutinin N-terminal domain-containing protein [Nostoc sp. FACHB-87]|uniref:two-partner secretion domain-containing protein n=1 Tax=Nostocaceae TaxID=1162 RepID=UPI0016849DFB|nr:MULTISPECIES: filamentous hemagglutinin N-terminal domain-containing protein [Nostocaceae]MBD2457456.1 filamentous hemagglutinin N-terminal domain-containing protein [Nostoc sp. FACHB-87]MBD2477576.1 filamentous hemagglutinin N-terminal domain-containing protein [Anabaena sp. FACHB-83]
MKSTLVFLGSVNGLLLILETMLFWSSCVKAQVVSDGTLNTTVNSANAQNFIIENGTVVNNNLFHSFSQFSIPTGGSATFDLGNTPNISTIFSRVTGGSISHIDGLIQSINHQNPVNLFLINPSGIIFGGNAQININGSFIASTASSIKFADGSQFSTKEPTEPLLTVSIPIGLQIGANSGAIQVQGSGHNITRVGLSLLNRRAAKHTGLQVAPGRTLALVAGNISLDGGLLIADSGQIDLTALSNGEWILGQGNKFSTVNTTPNTQFGNIHLQSAALVDVSGMKSGTVQLRGRNITLQDGSMIVGQSLGEQISGDIQVIGTQSLVISGTNPAVSSRIATQSLGNGRGGNINISVPRLLLHDGGTIVAQTFSAADSGDINIQANDFIGMRGSSAVDATDLSAITTATFNTGSSGKLTVSTNILEIRDGAQITNSTLGKGNASHLIINANKLINIEGNSNAAISNSAIVSNSFGEGNGGQILVNTPILQLKNGGAILSSGYSSGNAGDITINAKESVEIINSSTFDFSPVGTTFLNSRISSDIVTPPDFLQAILGLPTIATGNSGSIVINTHQITLTNGASVSVANTAPRKNGQANVGDLKITTNYLTLQGRSRLLADTFSSEGGNIQLQVRDLLLLRDNSSISTTAGLQETGGNGGNIDINTKFLVAVPDENSDITANAFSGKGGLIRINAQGIFGIETSETLTKRSDITAFSQQNPLLNGEIIINTPNADISNELAALPTNVVDVSRLITQGCAASTVASRQSQSQFIITGRGGIPPQPNHALRVPAIAVSENTLTTNTPNKHLNITPIFEANSWTFDHQGQVTLNFIPKPHIANKCYGSEKN